jgi:radical SAM-linked protein
MNDNLPIKQRLYIRFGKFDALIYTSNLDVAKTWERVLRRANLPILYSQGFNTRPRIALASALPLGISSECEILDVSMREPLALEGLAERIQATSPTGLRIYDIYEVPVRSGTLPTRVRSSEYRIHFEDPIDHIDLQTRINKLINSDTMSKMKDVKGKPVSINVRSLVYDLHIDEKTGDLIAHLAVGDRGNVRPDEVLAEIGMADAVVSVHRFKLYIDPE